MPKPIPISIHNGQRVRIYDGHRLRAEFRVEGCKRPRMVIDDIKAMDKREPEELESTTTTE